MGGLIIPSLGRAHLGADLRRNRALCGTMLEIVPSLVLAIDAQGNVVDLNRACRETTGFSLRDFRGRPVWNLLFVPEKSEAVRCAVCACQTDAASRVVEAELITKGGERRHSRWVVQATPALRQDPQLVLLAGIDCADLVERNGKCSNWNSAQKNSPACLGKAAKNTAQSRRPGRRPNPMAESRPADAAVEIAARATGWLSSTSSGSLPCGAVASHRPEISSRSIATTSRRAGFLLLGPGT